MYCENDKGKRVDLSSKENASCSGPKCGGWKWVKAGCAPWNSACQRSPGAWLPAAEVCRMNLYAKFEKKKRVSDSSDPTPASSSSSSNKGSKALIYQYPCLNSCSEGCCTESGWFCCADGFHCADSEGSCPQSSSVSGDSFVVYGTTIVLSDYFDQGSSIDAFTGVTGGELLVPFGYNYAVFISADGSVHEEFVVPGQVLVFRSTILLGSKQSDQYCGYCDCGAPEPCSWKDCGTPAPGYTNIFNCDTCKCVETILFPTGNSSSSSSSHEYFEVISASVSRQLLYGTVTTVDVPYDAKNVDREFYGSVVGGSDVVEMNSTSGVFSGMYFSVLGDCVHSDITSFSSEVILVNKNNITLRSPVPGTESCASAAIAITGPVVPVFEFDGVEITPDRIGPSSEHPDGCPDIGAGQYQFFYDFGGSSLRVARESGAAFSSVVQIQPLESSSVSSLAMPEVSQFWELEVDATGQEFMVVSVVDPQLSTQIEIADQIQVTNQCYYVKFEEDCPLGYLDHGFVEPCDGPCDKVCCPDPTALSSPMVCGKAYSGDGGHNSPWDFHLDPKTVRLSYASYLTENSRSDLTPSQIDASLGSDLAEGTECCFPVKGSVRLMEIFGFDHCYDPLVLSAERRLDESSGSYVMKTSCLGECENLEGNSCLDAEINANRDELQIIVDSAAEEFAALSPEQTFAWLLESGENIFQKLGIDPQQEYSEEEIRQIFLDNYVYPPSSSSSGQMSSSSSEPRNPRGRWDDKTAYYKNDLVSHDGFFYSAKLDMPTDYAIGHGPEGWYKCPDAATVASYDNQCPGYGSLNPRSFVEGWSFDPDQGSYLPKSFDSGLTSVSSNPLNPTNVALETGRNYLFSSVGGAKSETYFSFEVPQGRKIVGTQVAAVSSELSFATIGIRSGLNWASGSVVSESSFGSSLGGSLFVNDFPLGSGFYSMKIASSMAEFDYALILVMEQQ